MTAVLLSATMENFTRSLVILVQGMAGIFVFMAVFYLVIFALERLFKEKKVQ
ncbi:MAG: hypothetical protein K0B87_08120 [Candidatus Syntrophosphaera sp.]|nr:hypothetical protein [Candidatus Syntrophosphaera sp.]